MKSLRLVALAAILALCLPLAARANEEDPERAVVLIKAPTRLTIKHHGGSLTLPARATSLTDDFLVDARSPELNQIASPYGAQLSWDGRALVCRKDGQTTKLAINQDRFPETPEGRNLNLVAQELDGIPMVPLSILEDMLGGRLTVQGDNAWFEPLIKSVRVDGKKLLVESTLAVKCKTFRLKEPDRFVIDVPGAVLDTGSNKFEHPELGMVRLGQFQLGPAISRIVIPTAPGVNLRPTSGSGNQLAFALTLPRAASPAAGPAAASAPGSHAQAFPGAKITSVLFEPMVGGNRLVVTADGPIQYEWRRYKAPDNRFVLDIPKAALVGAKQDFLARSAFLSVVRVSQFTAEPDAVVRIVCELESPALTRINPGDEENSFVLEIMDQPAVAYSSDRGYGATSFPRIGGGIICIDPGHGGSDPGAINRALGICEADVTLDICLRLAEILKKEGWNVVMTRTDDRDVSWAGSPNAAELGARVKVGDDYGADLFVSVHCNSSAGASANGTSTYYYKSSDYLLAQELHGNLVNATGRANRGMQKDRFYVLSHSKIPAVLIETAFLSNTTEGKLLNTPEFRQQVAQGIAVGLRQYASRYLNKTTANR